MKPKPNRTDRYRHVAEAAVNRVDPTCMTKERLQKQTVVYHDCDRRERY